MLVSLCFIALFAVLFIISLVWYMMKLRSFRYTGRTEAKLTKGLRQVKAAENDAVSASELVFEYEVDGERHSIRRLRKPELAELNIGSTVEVAYDEEHPGRAELVSTLENAKNTRTMWMIVPVMALIFLIMVVFFNIPQLFDFTREQRSSFGIITKMMTPVVLGAMVIQAMLDPNSALNRKRKHPKLIGAVGLGFCALYIVFCIILLLIR